MLALLARVNVHMTMARGDTPSCSKRAMRYTRVVVFPDPAQASINMSSSKGAFTICYCSSLSGKSDVKDPICSPPVEGVLVGN